MSWSGYTNTRQNRQTLTKKIATDKQRYFIIVKESFQQEDTSINVFVYGRLKNGPPGCWRPPTLKAFLFSLSAYSHFEQLLKISATHEWTPFSSLTNDHGASFTVKTKAIVQAQFLFVNWFKKQSPTSYSPPQNTPSKDSYA